MSVMAIAVIGSAAVGAYSADRQRASANRAGRLQNAANDAALAQNQQQFEASQALQMQIAGMANGTQRAIAGMQIAEVRRQFAEVQKVLSPFIQAGRESLGPLKQYEATGLEALGGQKDLLGMNGADAQGQAIQALQNSPEMAAYIQQGEASMLQNAAATGGLRGGNTQAAMAQFRPSLLNSMISQQYDRLGGLTSLGANTSGLVYQTGQNAAAGQASAGMQAAGQVGQALSQYSAGVGQAYGNLANASAQNSQGMANAYNNYYNNQGSIGAGVALANGQASANMANSISGALGSYAALQMMKGGGMGSNPNTSQLVGGNQGASYRNFLTGAF